MATGGYKSAMFSWSGDRSDTPVDRTKYVLNGICDAIIGANVGWQLDDLTPSSSDFIQMPSYDNAQYPNLLKIIKLVNDGHTYRMGIGNVFDDSTFYYNSGYSLKPSDCCNSLGNDYSNTNANGLFDGGIYFGLVKDGNFTSDNQYGVVWDENGVFTKWISFSGYRRSQYSCVRTNQNIATYYFILKGAQIGFFFRYSTWTSYARLKGFILGEIFKTTGHTSDSNTLGVACLFDCTDAEKSQPSDYYINSSIGNSSFLYMITNKILLSSIIDVNGNAYAGSYLQNGGRCIYNPYLAFDRNVVSNEVSSTITSPGGRWTPCYMELLSNDQSTYNVVPGDGFKGYLDSDFIRGVNPNYSYGQLLANGDFCYLGGGFAIGWDSSNDVFLF